MNYILFDDSSRNDLLPLSFTRPVSEFRVGILTITEKWNRYLGTTCSYQTEDYLSIKYKKKTEKVNCFINGSVLPDKQIVDRIQKLELNQFLIQGNVLIAAKLEAESIDITGIPEFGITEYDGSLMKISHTWDIFSINGAAIQADFDIITKGRVSASLDESNRIIGKENLFVEEGAQILCATINASTGPVYIGKDAVIMENSVIRGPFAMCEHAELKLASKIYGPTTLGPYCKVGGEVNNSVLFGYSSKAHDGFLGNSVLGEWCNLGADTNNSNLKNNYAEVKIWNYRLKRFVKTGLQFCGLIMGDHSKCAINTMFNTGTVVGVSANIFGAGFPRNFIPSFTWGGAQGIEDYPFAKACEVASLVMQRRSLVFDDIEKSILQNVFDQTFEFRGF